MKLIHTADIHLDSKLNTHFGDNKEKRKLRRQELLNSFRRLTKYASDNGVEGILISGDLFDTKIITKTTENVVISEISSHPDIKFYYLNGNHDEQSFLLSLEEKPDNLFLFGDEWERYDISEKISIYGAELSGSNDIYNSLVTDNTKINIVMLHGQESQYKGKDKTEIVNLSALRNKGIDYLALGHIHGYKRERLDGRGIYCYSGCLEGRGFDEPGQKGFVLLEINEDEATINDSFIPFSERIIHSISVDVTGLETTTEAEEAIKKILEEKMIPDKDIVEILLSGQVSMEAEFNEISIELTFAQDYFLFRVKNCTLPLIDYESYRLDETLKGEFVRLVSGSTELGDDEKSSIIKMGIELLTGK